MSSVAHNSNHLPLRKLTFEEFLDWCDEDTRAEWIDGRVVIMSPGSLAHQTIEGFLYKLLSIYVEKHQLGVIVQEYLMHLEAQRRGRLPDILFISKARTERIRKTYVEGAVDLAVEIVSPDSVDRDRSEKFAEYQLAGVREYWLIDPIQKIAEFFEAGTDRRFYPVPLCDGAFRSTVIPGFWLKPGWLWEDPLPETLDVLKQLGVI